jgi:hypothetical protein
LLLLLKTEGSKTEEKDTEGKGELFHCISFFVSECVVSNIVPKSTENSGLTKH